MYQGPNFLPQEVQKKRANETKKVEERNIKGNQ